MDANDDNNNCNYNNINSSAAPPQLLQSKISVKKNVTSAEGWRSFLAIEFYLRCIRKAGNGAECFIFSKNLLLLGYDSKVHIFVSGFHHLPSDATLVSGQSSPWLHCDQIGLFMQVLGNKFLYKTSWNIWQLFDNTISLIENVLP